MQSKTEQMGILAARSLLYSFVSALFSAPASEKFQLLQNSEMQDSVRTSAKYLEDHPSIKARNLEFLAQKLFASLSRDNGQLQEEFTRVFGHTLSKDTSPYELEHLKSKEVFALTQTLADVNGFYKAFGVEVDAGERADHLAIEAEFLSYLALKESVAIEAGEEENVRICFEAQRDFWKEHFGWWTEAFSNRLTEEPACKFYRLASQFLQNFLHTERKTLA